MLEAEADAAEPAEEANGTGVVVELRLDETASEFEVLRISMQSDSALAPSPSMYLPAGRWAPLSVSGLLQNLPHVQLIYQTSD